MKKIISGIAGLIAVVALVAGIGYALFSDSVSMSGMVLGTATPGLELSLDGSTWVSSFDLPDSAFAKLLPGEMDWGEFYLKNSSNGTTDKLDMNLAAKLVSAAGDWGVLKDAIQMRVCFYNDTPAYHCDEANATAWYTLASWNAGEVTLPGSPLVQGSQQRYAIVFYIPSSYGNEISGKTVTDINFTITGTQNP